MPQTILERQATLQKKGELQWRKRYGQNNSVDDELRSLRRTNKYNVQISEEKTSMLESKKDELDAASKKWKYRVKKSDADEFSVSGRMEKSKESIPINIPEVDNAKKIPKAKSFRGKENSSSTPTSPEKFRHSSLKRSHSNPDPCYQTPHFIGPARKVPIIRTDDFTFTNFYKSIENNNDRINEPAEMKLEDFDVIERQSLLVLRKNIKIQKRRATSRNPIKALAQRKDIKQEYTEVLTGVAERETRNLKIEKLAKNSNLAVTALAGLASEENFKSVSLKKNGSGPSTLLPYKDIMLIQIKGRRNIQVRLVEPIIESINQGDCFLLVTQDALYSFIGAYSNIIEQARATDIANHIKKTHDLGCKVTKIITIDSKNEHTLSKDEKNFWKLLGDLDPLNIAKAGNPSEDEIYESNMSLINMIYGLENDELIPLDRFWGSSPKYEILSSTSVLVFDFGTEMYIWSGKNASSDKKHKALKLAKELWSEGFNYSECSVCPFNIAQMLGERTVNQLPKKSDNRPGWALFCRVTQHRETILFKEKFLDWPDFSRIAIIKEDVRKKNLECFYNIKPIDVDKILSSDTPPPDIVIEGYRLVRGDSYFDEETNRILQFDTLKITVWRIVENTYETLSDEYIGQFYDADTFIVEWKFRITVKGRELSGKPSKYDLVGRNHTVYFFWQGCKSSINEKGVAALLTIELNSESHPQIRIAQGCEPPAFLQLFNGNMVIHKGKMSLLEQSPRLPKLFIVRGEIEREACLLEVSCKAHQLRSRSSFLLIDSEHNEVTMWHGCKSSRQTRNILKQCVEQLLSKDHSVLNLEASPKLKQLEEGSEDKYFNQILGNTKKSYHSLLKSKSSYDYTPKFFFFSSTSGTFSATEICSPHKSEHSSPFPILQDQLYSSTQPALFLIDNEYELWLWHGWWYEKEGDDPNTSDQTGSGAIRWQAERRAAMTTAKNYWIKKHGDSHDMTATLVWAGLETMEFQNLFPFWEERKDVAEMNLKEGKQILETKNLKDELEALSRSVFSLSELLERPLPEGVDPTHLEDYLSCDDFEKVLSVSREEFHKLPLWKQTSLKKEKGLF